MTELTAIPNGTEIDARKGTGAPHGAARRERRGSTARASTPAASSSARARARCRVTTLKLTGGTFAKCRKRKARRAGAARSRVAARAIPRSRAAGALWGNGRGRFRTRGRYGAATVRGTKWLTQDRCDGTLVRVKRGKVDVEDLQRPQRKAEAARGRRGALRREAGRVRRRAALPLALAVPGRPARPRSPPRRAAPRAGARARRLRRARARLGRRPGPPGRRRRRYRHLTRRRRLPGRRRRSTRRRAPCG